MGGIDSGWGKIIGFITDLAGVLGSFGGLGTAGWIAAGVFLIVLLGIGVGGYWLLKSHLAKQTEKENRNEASKELGKLPKDGTTIERDAARAEKEIEDLFK